MPTNYTRMVVALASAVLSLVGAVHVMERAVRRNNFVQLARSRPDVYHELVFAVQQKNLDVIEQELLTRSSPGSRSYQQWMTFNEIGALVSNAESAASVTQWLQNQGIEVTWKSKRHEYIKATAPIAKWEDLLSTTFFEWEDHSKPGHWSHKQRTVHRAIEYSLPADLTPHLSAVFNTVQTPPVWKPKYRRAETRNNASLRRAGQASSRSHTLSSSVTPSFLNTLYDITSNHGDAKQQQAVFETGGEYFSSADLSTFQQIYGLPQQAVSRDFGKDAADCNGHDCYEGNLDVQYLMAVAQDTQTVYWYQGGNDPFIDWITAVADDPDPPLVNSISWGSTEQANSESSMKAFNNEAMKLAAMGVTIVVSTGDNGAADDENMCTLDSSSKKFSPYWKGEPWTGTGYFPSFPATSPYVTAVGATMGPENGDPEIACQSQLGGVITTGGGFSTYNPTPSWQVDAVNAYFNALTASNTPTSGYNRNGRGYPDVSLIGVWYMTVVSGSEIPLFGTSASAPVFGAMISLINAARAKKNQSSVGFINPTLWASSGATPGNPHNLTLFTAFQDVTSGINKCMAYAGQHYENAFCCDSGFAATAGWDPVTGLGSITLPNLMKALTKEVVVPLSYEDDDDGEVPRSTRLIMIILLVLIGAVLVGTLLGGTIYALFFAPRVPSNYAPAGRTEVALTHYPDTQLQTVVMTPQDEPPRAAPPQQAPATVLLGGANNPLFLQQPQDGYSPASPRQGLSPLAPQPPRMAGTYAALPSDV